MNRIVIRLLLPLSAACAPFSLLASDAVLAATSPREADRLFAAYTNNELKVVSATAEEWDASNPYKIVDRLPANLPCALMVARPSDAARAEAAIETVTTSMPAHVRAYFTQYKVMGPFLNWMLRRCKPGVKDEATYLSPAKHLAVWSASDFDLPALAEVARTVTSNHVPLVTALQPIFGEFSMNPLEPAQPVVDYPDPRPELTFATPCGIGIVLRAVERRRKFRFAAYAGRPGDPSVNFKWVVMSTRPAAWAARIGRIHEQANLSPEKGYGEVVLDWQAIQDRLDVAVFARVGKGPYGPPSIISFYKVPNEVRTYDKEGRIDKIEYAQAELLIPELFQNKQWSDSYEVDDFGRVVGFSRKRYGQVINPERFSMRGEYIVEAHPSGLPKVARKVRYFTSPSDPGLLDYEITSKTVEYPTQTFSIRDRGEFPSAKTLR